MEFSWCFTKIIPDQMTATYKHIMQASYNQLHIMQAIRFIYINVKSSTNKIYPIFNIKNIEILETYKKKELNNIVHT